MTLITHAPGFSCACHLLCCPYIRYLLLFQMPQGVTVQPSLPGLTRLGKAAYYKTPKIINKQKVATYRKRIKSLGNDIEQVMVPAELVAILSQNMRDFSNRSFFLGYLIALGAKTFMADGSLSLADAEQIWASHKATLPPFKSAKGAHKTKL